MDNFFTGRKRNVEHWLASPYRSKSLLTYCCRIGHENFELLNHDVVTPLMIEGNIVCVVVSGRASSVW